MRQDYTINLCTQLQGISSKLQEIIQMVEDEQPCDQTIHQIGVVQQLLRELMCTLIMHQVRECLFLIRNDPDVNVRLHEMTRLQELYDEKLQTQLILNEVKL